MDFKLKARNEGWNLGDIKKPAVRAAELRQAECQALWYLTVSVS